MAAGNPLDILLEHDVWGTRNMLRACAALTEEQVHRPFEMGPGSPHATLSHIVGAIRAWGDALAGREQRPRVEEKPRTLEELSVLFDEVAADFAASARAHPVDEVVTRIRAGKSYSFNRGGVITHVATHGMHHRAQMLNMLRQLGVSELPASSVLDWMLSVDGGR